MSWVCLDELWRCFKDTHLGITPEVDKEVTLGLYMPSGLEKPCDPSGGAGKCHGTEMATKP